VGEAAPGPGAAMGTGLPGSSWGAEVGFCAIVGTLADDLRLEPNPSPLKREFIELIRCRRINKESVGRRQMELNQSVRRRGKGKGWTERLLGCCWAGGNPTTKMDNGATRTRGVPSWCRCWCWHWHWFGGVK